MLQTIRIFILTLSAGFTAARIFAEPISLASHSPSPENSHLVMGGSYGPITSMHLALMADSIYVHEFSRGTFVVAYPYKQNAASGDVALHLTQVAVEHFYEILEQRNLPYRDFRVLAPGKVQWITGAGRLVTLAVSDFDLQHQVRYSIQTYKHFRSLEQDPRNLWFLAGGDSAASMPSWGAEWRDLFTHANSLFVGRQSESGEISIDDKKHDPLRGVYPDDFLEHYTYRVENGVHIYGHKDRRMPGIYVLQKQTLTYSSTQARRSLPTTDQRDAQLMLTPAVYRTILEFGYLNTSRRYMTVTNLANYLRSEFEHIESNTGNPRSYVRDVTELVQQVLRADTLPNIEFSTTKDESNFLKVRNLNQSEKELLSSLLQFDPFHFLSRLRWTAQWGIAGSSIDINLIRSRLSSDVPLEIRNRDNETVRWYDLNISTNELQAIVDSEKLTKMLFLYAGSRNGSYANYLWTAASLTSQSQQRLELFVGQRYIQRLLSTNLSAASRLYFNEEEIEFRQKFNDFVRSNDHLNDSESSQLHSSLVAAYLVAKVAALHPDWLSRPMFWRELISLTIMHYPGLVVDINNPNHMQETSQLVTVLEHWLPKLVNHIPNIYRSPKTVLSLPQWALLWKPFVSKELELAANFNVFRDKPGTYEFVSRFLDPVNRDENLVKDVVTFQSEIVRETNRIERSFAKMPTENVPHEKYTVLLKDIKDSVEQLELLLRELLSAKIAQPHIINDRDLSVFKDILSRYQLLQKEALTKLEKLRLMSYEPLQVAPDIFLQAQQQEKLSPGLDLADEYLWNELLSDIIGKYINDRGDAVFGDSVVEIMRLLRLEKYEVRSVLPLQSILRLATEGIDPTRDMETSLSLAEEAANWLHDKYGLQPNQPLLRRMKNGGEGSYRSHDSVQFMNAAVSLPSNFNPDAASSLSDQNAYIARKWGGLRRMALPQRILFSELGTHDTLHALRLRGFNRFFQVNAPYSMRGSKTLIAYEPSRSDPLLVFHSFVGKDLLLHKQMQLAIEFSGEFKHIRLLSSDGPKSWDRAHKIVTEGINSASLPPIDDLVLGYGTDVVKMFAKYGFRSREFNLGDYAKIRVFDIVSKNGLRRSVGVIEHIAYRYFGRSVLPVIKPFLERGIKRVIFAGSAGVLLENVPIHSLVTPRVYHQMSESSSVCQRIAIENDLYDLLPYGQSFAGAHLSVASPCVESQTLVDDLRSNSEILSIDVEGSEIANLIADYNTRIGPKVRFANAFIVTDHPHGSDDIGRPDEGLHNPDFTRKSYAKDMYASTLALLFDLPNRFVPSAHTKIIGGHFAEELKKGIVNEQTLTTSQIRIRRDRVLNLAQNGQRVSRGLRKTYDDLLEAFPSSKGAEFSFPAEASNAVAVDPSEQVAKAIILQSFTRSSTLNSGEVFYRRKEDSGGTKNAAIIGTNAAVELLFRLRSRELNAEDIHEAHRLFNAGILPPQSLGSIRVFSLPSLTGSHITSAQSFDSFIEWLSNAKPNSASASGSFLRFEELHPYSDGNGRIAEWIAQHTLLRAGLSPILFPHRFDIDYILSLLRNGGDPNENGPYLQSLVKSGNALAEGLLNLKRVGEFEKVFLDPSSGLVTLVMDDGRTFELHSQIATDRKISLEREKHVILAELPLLDPQATEIVTLKRRHYTHRIVANPCAMNFGKEL